MKKVLMLFDVLTNLRADIVSKDYIINIPGILYIIKYGNANSYLIAFFYVWSGLFIQYL